MQSAEAPKWYWVSSVSKRRRSLEIYVHRKMPAWFGGERAEKALFEVPRRAAYPLRHQRTER